MRANKLDSEKGSETPVSSRYLDIARGLVTSVDRPRFKVGQAVDFTNDQGVSFPNHIVAGIEKRDGKFRYFITPDDSPWFPKHERNLALAKKLPAYRVTYQDGGSYVTSMAKGVTLEDARAYFIDASIEQPDGSCKRVANVEMA